MNNKLIQKSALALALLLGVVGSAEARERGYGDRRCDAPRYERAHRGGGDIRLMGRDHHGRPIVMKSVFVGRDRCGQAVWKWQRVKWHPRYHYLLRRASPSCGVGVTTRW